MDRTNADNLTKEEQAQIEHIRKHFSGITGGKYMKIVLKILSAPIILVLSLFVWICSALLYCSAFLFGLAATVIALLGLTVLVTYSLKNGIILLLIAFVVSPIGLPMAAAWLLGQVQDWRYAIQDYIYR